MVNTGNLLKFSVVMLQYFVETSIKLYAYSCYFQKSQGILSGFSSA